MKILVATGGVSSLGGFFLPMIKRFVAEGHEVVATACEDDSKTHEILSQNKVRFVPVIVGRTSINPFADFCFLIRLTRFMRCEKFDCVLLIQQKPILYGGLAAKLAGTPKIFAMVTGLGYAFIPHPGLKSKIVRFVAGTLYRIVTNFFAGMLFQNPDDLALISSQFLRKKRVPVKRIFGLGVDLQHFAFAPVSQSNITFLYIGRLVVDKGTSDYVMAGKVLRSRNIVAELRVLGGFDVNPAAISKEQMQTWEREGFCKYFGKTSDVRPILRESAVFVLPSHREGTPQSAMEAMSTGRALIMANTPGCRETVFFEKTRKKFVPEKNDFEEIALPAGTPFDVRNFLNDILLGDNGLLVPAKNPEALASAMQFYLEHPEFVALHGNASRALAESYYDVNQVNNEICSFIFAGTPKGGEK